MDPVTIRWPRYLWDPISRANFDPRTVTYYSSEEEGEARFQPADILELSGAPKDSKVTCSNLPNEVTRITVESDIFVEPLQMTIYRDGGALVVDLVYLNLKNAQGGIGARIVLSAIRAARRLGFARLNARAIASRDELTRTGQHWAGAIFVGKLGFDSPLSESIIQTLPPELSAVNRLQQLLSVPHGAEWWHANARPLLVNFELAADSPNLNILRRYMVKKRLRIFQCFTRRNSK